MFAGQLRGFWHVIFNHYATDGVGLLFYTRDVCAGAFEIDVLAFGFIAQDGGKDVFVHHTAIIAEGFRSLSEGDNVEFEVVEGPKGLQASNVRKV